MEKTTGSNMQQNASKNEKKIMQTKKKKNLNTLTLKRKTKFDVKLLQFISDMGYYGKKIKLKFQIPTRFFFVLTAIHFCFDKNNFNCRTCSVRKIVFQKKLH